MKIEEVLQAHGSSLRDAAKAIGMKPSTLQATIDRNPTISTLRKIAEAAQCSVAEFFGDELEAMGLMITARPSSAEETKDTTASQVNKAAAPKEGAEQGGQAAEDTNRNSVRQSAAPEAPNQRAEEVRAVRFQYGCPHCGHQIQVCISEV